MTRSIPIFVAAFAVLLTMTGCATAPNSAIGTADTRRNADLALANAQQNDPSLAKTLLDAAGYAVFPTVGKDATPAGASYATGALYEFGSFVGFCDVTQVQTGVEFAGRAYSQIIVLRTEEAVYDFKSSKAAFGARDTAQALQSSANLKYMNNVAVLIVDDAGRMYEATVGGQKFNYQAPDWTTAVTVLED